MACMAFTIGIAVVHMASAGNFGLNPIAGFGATPWQEHLMWFVVVLMARAVLPYACIASAGVAECLMRQTNRALHRSAWAAWATLGYRGTPTVGVAATVFALYEYVDPTEGISATKRSVLYMLAAAVLGTVGSAYMHAPIMPWPTLPYAFRALQPRTERMQWPRLTKWQRWSRVQVVLLGDYGWHQRPNMRQGSSREAERGSRMRKSLQLRGTGVPGTSSVVTLWRSAPRTMWPSGPTGGISALAGAGVMMHVLGQCAPTIRGAKHVTIAKVLLFHALMLAMAWALASMLVRSVKARVRGVGIVSSGASRASRQRIHRRHAKGWALVLLIVLIFVHINGASAADAPTGPQSNTTGAAALVQVTALGMGGSTGTRPNTRSQVTIPGTATEDNTSHLGRGDGAMPESKQKRNKEKDPNKTSRYDGYLHGCSTAAGAATWKELLSIVAAEGCRTPADDLFEEVEIMRRELAESTAPPVVVVACAMSNLGPPLSQNASAERQRVDALPQTNDLLRSALRRSRARCSEQVKYISEQCELIAVLTESLNRIAEISGRGVPALRGKVKLMTEK
jgi:hypothetical protein